ncbi:MAG: C39 family peptidase [Candidatus Nomurabacteria bacterium]|nr:MAG: C39 family peptidase [Candidatus Nomurabacteria bacterium]
MKKGIIIIIALVLLLGLGYWQRGWIRDTWDSISTPELPEPTAKNAVVNTSVENSNSTTTNTAITNTVVTLPDEINLDVPFSSQAPFANWDLPYQEACEETAALMVQRYWEDEPLTKEDADRSILAIVDFEEQHYGFYQDTTGEETARFIRDLWGYEVEVSTGDAVTALAIKQEIAQGHPIIVLAAGRQLGNPNFTSPGPIYHALVVKGYTKDGHFITNDPGTRNGADYVYEESVLMNAIHDWNGGDVDHGQKVMLVVTPAK